MCQLSHPNLIMSAVTSKELLPKQPSRAGKDRLQQSERKEYFNGVLPSLQTRINL